MKDHMPSYKKKLEERIGDYMEMPVSEHSANAVKSMVECWEEITRLEKGGDGMVAGYANPGTFTHEDAKAWCAKMQNEDGSMGAHWTIDQTTGVAQSMGIKFEHITDWCWWVTMNMMYSDYYGVAVKFGVSAPEFYANLSKAFLFDQDGPGPEAKLGAYYHCIVNH